MTMKPNFILAVALAALAVTSSTASASRVRPGARDSTRASDSASRRAACCVAQPMDAPLPDVKVIVDKVKSRSSSIASCSRTPTWKSAAT